MTIYFFPINAHGYPDPIIVHRSLNAWKIYMICLKPLEKASLIYQDRRAIDKRYHNTIEDLFAGLLRATDSGQPLSAHYHKKGDLHPAFTITYTNHENISKQIKIYRVRQGDIRLYFIYRSENTIILLKMLVKLEKTLPASEQNKIEKLAKLVLRLKDPENINQRLISVNVDE